MTEPVKRYYIMESSVVPMLDKQMTYTPLVNYKTDVHVVPLVMAADYARLEQECERLRNQLEEMRPLLDEAASTLATSGNGLRLIKRIDAALSAKP